MEVIFLIYAMLLAAGVVAAYWARRLTKSWPVVLSLLVTAFVVALLVTPSIMGGWCFVVPVPVVFVLFDSIAKGNLNQLIKDGIIPITVVGGVLYVILLVGVLVRYAVGRWRTGRDV